MGADLPLLFIEGLLAFISPCILPMLPVYLMYLAAETEHGKRASVANTVAFVCGFTLVFMAFGATATAIGTAMNAHRMLLQRVSGAVIILFGLHFLGVLRIGFLDVEKKLELGAKRGGLLGALVFGAAFSLGWTPCLGPFLGAALLLAGNTDTVATGVFYLFVFSMGLGVPYILSALFFTSIKGVFQWLRRHGKAVKTVSGIVLIVMGLMLLTDMFGYYAALFDSY
ncbi:cytochrome c biogenesis protein CcdA [Synergistaceae bacterium OttesenSCG-928-D05]|nr:cytochrome c biogenesis protein CcdA [Synergistaceae bacterium OttesenSCG-928-D05]